MSTNSFWTPSQQEELHELKDRFDALRLELDEEAPGADIAEQISELMEALEDICEESVTEQRRTARSFAEGLRPFTERQKENNKCRH